MSGVREWASARGSAQHPPRATQHPLPEEVNQVNCRKCGAELHPDQKVCIECGTRTAAGGGFDYGEETRWRPSPKMIKMALGAVALLLLVCIVYKLVHVAPPETVAREWFSAMIQRQTRTAQDYLTPKVEQDLQNRMMDLGSLSDDLRLEVSQGSYRISSPIYSGAGAESTAEVTISITPNSGAGGKDVRIRMVKVGRVWKINEIT